MQRAAVLLTGSLLLLLLLLVACATTTSGQGISIRPADFERYIMPCYYYNQGGGGGMNFGGGGGGGYQAQPMYTPSGAGGYQAASSPPLASGNPASGASSAGFQAQFGRNTNAQQYQNSRDPSTSSFSSGEANRLNGPMSQAPTSYLGSSSNQFGGQREAFGTPMAQSPIGGALGQSMPRANTIDNFIALVSKIEVAAPRLANNPEQLIRALLSRFHLDNYYYDTRMRTSIVDQDRRYSDIVPALLSGNNNNQQQQQMYGAMDGFPELALDHNERCSMYFMLSHFIDKSAASTSSFSAMSAGGGGGQLPLSQLPVQQLGGAQYGQRPPSLQAAASGYPAQSAQAAYSSQNSAGGGRPYSGPSPSFGSPATANMNAFATGLSNSNPEFQGKSPYGVNTPNAAPYNSLLANSQLRNPQALFPGGAGPMRPAVIDAASGRGGGGGGRNAGQMQEVGAIEFGVVALANQENAALVLNRVLLGLLAASAPSQTIRQLASLIYPTRDITQTPKLDEEIDPLFAVTLADLWAIGAIPKAGKQFDLRQLGDNGRWNDTMCPTSFALERSSSIKFTTAELLGGLDGFNLGQLRRRLLSMRRNLKLSELLRIYYSRNGFRPQLAEFGVCSRATGLMLQMDELHRQAENYLRLYQLSSPISDQEIAQTIARLDYFRDYARQAVQQYSPQELCQESSSSGTDFYPAPNSPEQCEISRADLVTVLDASPQANGPFMQLVIAKLAQKLGLSRDTSSLTILTNQQDSTGYAGAYSFNAIVRNSTNLAEIGCALSHDSSASYQGGQVTEPTRLMEMFERALINLDSEYLTRAQQLGGGGGAFASSNQNTRQSYVSTWFNGDGSSSQSYTSSYTSGGGGGPRNTGGAKIIIWFNYNSNQQARPAPLSSGPTNWAPEALGGSSGSSQEYRFYEAKKYLRENFRGASILAVSPNRQEVKAFVYDEERDIFTDIPAGSNALDSSGVAGSQTGADYYAPSQDYQSQAMLQGPAEALTSKLLARMCTIPALFQYPQCFRTPSSNEMSVGYISPGRKQFWMMSPKSFFASKAVRLVFRVEGGRLRVCFGRQPNPDESALRNQQQQQQYGGSQMSQISFSSSSQQQQAGGAADYNQRNQQQDMQQQQQQQMRTTTQAPILQASSGDYYTGLEYGVCKELSPGQEIDFVVSDPCWRKSIAECEPFYFVLRELSQPGEGDPNYMCRDSGCQRFDQVKFMLSHTGVSCSSAVRTVRAMGPHLLLAIALLSAWFSFTQQPSFNACEASRDENAQQELKTQDEKEKELKKTPKIPRRGRSETSVRYLKSVASLMVILGACLMPALVQAQQQAGVYDFGQNRYGEKRGNLTPSEWLAIILIVMLNVAGLALAIGLCFYVTKRAKQRGHAPIPQQDY